MSLLALFFLFVSGLSSALSAAEAAPPSWLCTEESSQKRDNEILACGIGTGSDENTARLSAFDNAKTEFTKVCTSSDDCKDHTISVEPRRTSCEQTLLKPATYKCYRLLAFIVGLKSENQKKRASSTQSEATLADSPEVFEPFSFETVANLPKIKKGMNKKSLFELFGAPDSIAKGSFDGTRLQIFFSGKMCLYQGSSCYVIIENDKVTDYDDFKPIYTDDIR